MAVVTSNPPEQGQLVTVRQRQYVVSEVAKSTLSATPLQPLGGDGQHLVTLASVEDDALGEELQVIWDLEPGATVIEDVPLPEPTGFDAPDRLDAFLDAVRWGASSTADVRNVQSPFRSGITIEVHPAEAYFGLSPAEYRYLFSVHRCAEALGFPGVMTVRQQRRGTGTPGVCRPGTQIPDEPQLKTTSLIPWSGLSRCPGSACSLPTTWVSARPSRPAWSTSNSSSGIGPGGY